MLPRFFYPDRLASGASVALPPAVAHHATRVLRLGEGDQIILFDGQGGEWVGHLRRIGKAMNAVLASFVADNRQPSIKITLAQGLPVADKMDWIVQKAVELGVAHIAPIVCRRSVVRLSGERMARRVAHWQAIIVAACEQCRRNLVPEVTPLCDLPQFLGAAADDGLRLLLAPEAETRLVDLPKPASAVTLLIGPEGGLEESEQVAAASAGFQNVSLGPRVLRTETAGPAALAAMMALWGDF
jgi:16S rRNA (uracil1498-N3)-methyltransferase